MSVKENIPAGTFIYQPQAFDEDTKNHWYPNGGDELLYFLNDPLFAIDPNTGENLSSATAAAAAAAAVEEKSPTEPASSPARNI